MQLTGFSILALYAVGAFALPEPAKPVVGITERDAGQLLEARGCKRAILPNCQGASYLGNDSCKCDGQKKPCGLWKCNWDGPKSVLNCGSEGSGCTWIN